MPEGASTRLLLPIGAGVALAASAAVWVVPLEFLKPSAITGSEEGAPPFPPPPKPKPVVDPGAKPEQKKDWLAYAKIDNLRDKPAVAPEGPGTTVVEQPVTPKVELHWQYLGFAGTKERPAAFMAMGSGSQRVVFLNEQVPDANDPNGTLYTIKHIDTEKVVVGHEQSEQTFEIAKRDTDLKAVAPTKTPKQRPPTMGGVPGINPANPPGPVSPVQPNPTSPNTPGVRAR